MGVRRRGGFIAGTKVEVSSPISIAENECEGVDVAIAPEGFQIQRSNDGEKNSTLKIV